MKTTPTPHDALLKPFLTHPETARDFLQQYLPLVLLKTCDLSMLRLETGNFVEEDFLRRSVFTQGGEGRWIRLLFD